MHKKTPFPVSAWLWLMALAAAMLFAGVALILSGCASAPTAMDRALLDIRTNWAPLVVVQTNVIRITNEVPVTNVIREVIERPVVRLVTNEAAAVVVITNIILTTNITIIHTVTNLVDTVTSTATVTNLIADSVRVTPRPAAADAVQVAGSLAGDALGGWGVLASLAANAALGLYARSRQKRFNAALGRAAEAEDTAATLAQVIETGRELMKSTPQGSAIEDKWKHWMISHQAQQEVIESVARIVASEVDHDGARHTADRLLNLMRETRGAGANPSPPANG